MTSQQFERARDLARQLAGIVLLDRHRELLHRRSRRIGITDAAGWESLLDGAEAGEATALRCLVSLVTTNFTGFFRHARHFEVAAQHAMATVERRGRARLWSTAAATGEEPYSLAMALIEAFGHDDPPATILASDIDAVALATAERGEYGEPALRSLDPPRRDRFFRRTAQGCWSLAPAVRRLVAFRTLNLTHEFGDHEGPFDVIFCRNVLIYLEAFHRGLVLGRVISLLALDGILILDPVENPGQAGHLLVSGAHGIYTLRRADRTRVQGDRPPACSLTMPSS